MQEVLIGDKHSSLDKWAKKIGADPGFARSLAKSIKEPEEAPYLLERITNAFSNIKKTSKKEVRNALLRVQIHCSLDSNSDPIRVSKQLYMAQVLEKLFFGSNLLLREEEVEEEEKARVKKPKGKRAIKRHF
jgi:hypothetical protein